MFRVFFISDPGTTRTCGHLLRRQMLYPLSYGAKEVANVIKSKKKFTSYFCLLCFTNKTVSKNKNEKYTNAKGTANASVDESGL